MEKELRLEQIAVKRGYIVSEEGVLYNPKGNKIGSIHNSGYHRTNIRINKKETNLMAHRLQAYQKYGDILYNKGVMVRHYNGNKLDNSWGNILIGNNSQNQLDIPKNIRIKRSLNSWKNTRKYDRDEVIEYYNKVKSYKKTKEKFDISSSGTLHFILNGRK